ncbi:MAG TPA: metalloregulator ArsR/SmtB family transcription factor [Gemmatimonadaceae bacterium]|nr:metalloregulator ArsR/SmtB family transcription factor [Gemmatimonadaceae bacterium]
MQPTPLRTDPFQAIAHPARRAILGRLRQGEAPVAELAAHFAISRPAISRHLRVLRDARLVRQRRGRDGRQHVYRLTPQPLREVAEWIQVYQEFWPANLASLKRHLESATRRTEDRER